MEYERCGQFYGRWRRAREPFGQVQGADAEHTAERKTEGVGAAGRYDMLISTISDLPKRGDMSKAKKTGRAIQGSVPVGKRGQMVSPRAQGGITPGRDLRVATGGQPAPPHASPRAWMPPVNTMRK